MSESPGKAVFLSYASQDAEAARRICEALRAGGVEVWFDADGGLEHGDEWDAKIRRQIKDCVLFLPVISASTQARHEGYFRIEWELAAQRAMGIASGVPFLLPVVIDGTREPEALVPDRFRSVQWTRLPGGVVPTEVQQRFLKLWAQRTGTVLPGRSAPPMDTSTPLPEIEAPARRHGFPRAGLIIASGVLLVGLGVWMLLPPKPPATPPTTVAPARTPPVAAEKSPALDPRRIAVLPLDNFSVDANDEYLASGLTEELISCLSNISGLEVTPRLSSDRMKKSGKSLPEIGSELRVGTVLQGSVRKAGEQLRISVQLIDVASQRNLWSRDHNTVFNQNVFKMQSDVAEGVAAALQVKLLGSEVQRLRKEPTASIEAYQLYLKGGFHLAKSTEEGTRKARDYFNQALVKDPDFALAYSGLAVATDPAAAPRTAWLEAEKAARKALELDDTLADAHLALGRVRLDFDWNWAAAEAEFKAALALKPNLSYAHGAYANFLSMVGRPDEAIAAAKKAADLDPTNVAVIGGLCTAYGFARKYDQCLDAGLKCLELAPDFSYAHLWVGWAHAMQGKWAPARQAFERAAALERIPFVVWSIGCCDAMAGRTADARRALEELEQFSKSRYVSGKLPAAIHVYLGEKERALTLLEKCYDDRDDSCIMLKVDPIWDSLRAEPRFQALMTKMAFPP